MSSQTSNVGGWVVKPVITDGKLPEKLATGFHEAFENWAGASFKPLVFCGTQLVNGTNYMLICEETTITNPSETHVAKVIIHETLPEEGKMLGKFSVLLIERMV